MLQSKVEESEINTIARSARQMRILISGLQRLSTNHRECAGDTEPLLFMAYEIANELHRVANQLTPHKGVHTSL